MGLVGPGAQQDIPTDIKPVLEGASEFEFVTILNPLTDDFAVRVAQDVPVNMPFNIGRDGTGKTSQTTLSERDAAQTYGLALKNPDFQGRKHITNDTIIKSGETINLKGNEAQVAVRQLVNEIMQREGNKRLLADPTLRAQVEERIIIARGSIQDLMDGRLTTPRNQADEAIKRSNEVKNEQPTPRIDRDTSTEVADPSTDGGTDIVQQERRGPGRPKKA